MNTSSLPLNRRAFLTRMAAAAGLTALISRATSQPSLAVKAALEDLNKAFASSGAAADEMAKSLENLAVTVQGAAIKVPSNRHSYLPPGTVCTPESFEQQLAQAEHRYIGEWDGTFILEKGCTNPAYILADLYERTGAEPDWAVAAKVPVSPLAPMVMDGISQLLKPQLNWRMLYDWGRISDDLSIVTTSIERIDGQLVERKVMRVELRPSFTVNTVCHSREEMVELREHLRMHCLSWQSTDPRYRTSYPGIPHPGDHA